MHTKGPWKLFEGEHSEIVEVLDNRGLPVVSWVGFDDSRRTDEEHNANARLIAAAPELLEALENLIEIENRDNRTDPDIVASDEWRKEAWNKANEAIRKAKRE